MFNNTFGSIKNFVVSFKNEFDAGVWLLFVLLTKAFMGFMLIAGTLQLANALIQGLGLPKQIRVLHWPLNISGSGHGNSHAAGKEDGSLKIYVVTDLAKAGAAPAEPSSERTARPAHSTTAREGTPLNGKGKSAPEKPAGSIQAGSESARDGGSLTTTDPRNSPGHSVSCQGGCHEEWNAIRPISRKSDGKSSPDSRSEFNSGKEALDYHGEFHTAAYFKNRIGVTDPLGAMITSLHALEMLLLAPLPFLLISGLRRYVRRLDDRDKERSKRELGEFKALEVSLFIAIIAAATLERILVKDLDFQFAVSVTLVMVPLVTFYFLIERAHGAGESREHAARKQVHDHPGNTN